MYVAPWPEHPFTNSYATVYLWLTAMTLPLTFYHILRSIYLGSGHIDVVRAQRLLALSDWYSTTVTITRFVVMYNKNQDFEFESLSPAAALHGWLRVIIVRALLLSPYSILCPEKIVIVRIFMLAFQCC